MRILTSYQPPHVERAGFDPDLSGEERTLVENCHRFARDVLRPHGKALDRLSAAEVIAKDSPLWAVYAEYQKLGLDFASLDELEPAVAARLESLIVEELAWGDAGLTLSLGVAGFPLLVAQAAGNQELVDLAKERIGCWPVTQPDHGSDMVDSYGVERHPGSVPKPGNVVARFSGGEIVIKGQTSAWVSNGSIAQIAVLCCPADYGQGVVRPDGIRNYAVVIVPLDLPGVSRGKPLEKLGQITLPQGEIFFDDVRVPKRFAICEGESGAPGFLSVLSVAGVFMSQTFTGLARAAFEHALAYAHERRQGGAPLIEHQLVRWRLGEMYKRIEAARAMTRRAASERLLHEQGLRHPDRIRHRERGAADVRGQRAHEGVSAGEARARRPLGADRGRRELPADVAARQRVVRPLHERLGERLKFGAGRISADASDAPPAPARPMKRRRAACR